MKPLPPFPPPSLRRRRAVGVPLVAGLVLASLGHGAADAQSVEDWSTAPLTLPADPGGAQGGAPSGAAPPPRQILQPPSELRRPQAPLQPGDAPPPVVRPVPSVRVIPGIGVQPLPVRPPAAAAPIRSAPVRPAPLPSRRPTLPARPASPPTAPIAPAPTAADLERIRASLRQSRLAMPKPAVPNYLQSLPPGTLRPLPGEVLPGSRPPAALPGSPTLPGGSTLPPGAAPSPLQGMPPPPRMPQAVPPPPWLNPKPEPSPTTAPWAWLLTGLGIGGAGVFLAQERRRQRPGGGPLDALGIRVVARPDPGIQTLRPQTRADAGPGE